MTQLFKPPFDRPLFWDGAMGTMLQQSGLKPGELPETWNILHPEVIQGIHRKYLLAGADVITANTFGASPLKFSKEGPLSLERIVQAALHNARTAIEQADLKDKTPLVALSVGPLGHLLEPYGDLPFEDAVDAFAQTVRLGAQAGADLILIETMNDCLETKAAVLAAKENCALPVVVTNTYDAGGKLMTGADAAVMTAMLEGLRVDALGVNCGEGPQALLPTVRQLASLSSLPILASPNAGLPETRDGKLVYTLDEADFAAQMEQIAQAGATFLGGCCGTTPAYIAALTARLGQRRPNPIEKKSGTVACSSTCAVAFGGAPVLIGERLNPTGRAKMKSALRAGDMDYLVDEALDQQDAGAQVLDVNVGLPGIDEKETLCRAVQEIQSVVNLPLQLDSADPAALEAAMRAYNGKPMVNSVNGKAESMAAVFPLVQKYGGVLIALTLDENGIPPTAQGRVEIARKILAEAAKYGIESKDILVDPLAMAVSADPDAARVTLETLRLLKEQLGVRTSLGVSNVSFGLPGREMLTAAFFVLTMENGLDAAIVNPAAVDLQKGYHSFLVLHHLDDQCQRYIAYAQTLPKPLKAAPAADDSKKKMTF